MAHHGLKSDGLHPYQKSMQERTSEPLEWQKVSDSWILKFGGAVERKKLQERLKGKRATQ